MDSYRCIGDDSDICRFQQTSQTSLDVNERFVFSIRWQRYYQLVPNYSYILNSVMLHHGNILSISDRIFSGLEINGLPTSCSSEYRMQFQSPHDEHRILNLYPLLDM